MYLKYKIDINKIYFTRKIAVISKEKGESLIINQ